MIAALTSDSCLATERDVGKRANRQHLHGGSVRIYDSTHKMIGHIAEWWRVSRVIVVDVLMRDRLDALLEDASPRLRKVMQSASEPALPSFEDVVRDLFGIRLGPPAGGGDKEPLAQASTRVNEPTHAAVGLMTEWHDRTVPYLYAALLNDRLAKMHKRMVDELPPHGKRSDFRTAVREVLRMEIPADLLEESGGEVGVRRTFSRPRPEPRKPHKKETH